MMRQTALRIDKDDVARFLTALHGDGSVFEVRIPNTSAKTVSGYFNDIDAAVKAIVDAEREFEPPAIYCTLNPVKPELLARACNRLKPWSKATTTDRQIVERRWLFVDIDPVREADISSTDQEVSRALELAELIRDECDWPAEVRGMSGNGAYLLYRLDLANDDEATRLVQSALKAFDQRWSTARVKVDVSTHNAARICKVLGTVARKGEDLRGVAGLDDRPWRVSWVSE